MNGTELLDKIAAIDPACIEAAENASGKKGSLVWIKYAAAAACFCLLTAAAVTPIIRHNRKAVSAEESYADTAIENNITPDSENIIQDEKYDGAPMLDPVASADISEESLDPEKAVTPDGEAVIDSKKSAKDSHDSTPAADKKTEGEAEGCEAWSAFFNEGMALSADSARKFGDGYFTEELDGEALESITPDMRWGYMEYSGFAGFDGNGTPVDVQLTVSTSIPDISVRAVMSESRVYNDYILVCEEPVTSVINGIEYTACQCKLGTDSVLLQADAVINGLNCTFSCTAPEKELAKAKHDFSGILECFSWWRDGRPDISQFAPQSVPEFMNNSLSLDEARKDADFGAFLPPDAPAGFTAESVRRYKDKTNDYLSAVWTKGYDELRWNISFCTDYDLARLTSVAETEKYDLSLYPIPRADSVPDELREVVNCPVFSAQELTPDAVRARAYKTDEAGDSRGYRMLFSVKYGDIIVTVSGKGIDPDWVYAQLSRLSAE